MYYLHVPRCVKHSNQIVLLTFLTFATAIGLRCYSCNGIGGRCETEKDYGMSLECEGSCVKHYEYYYEPGYNDSFYGMMYTKYKRYCTDERITVPTKNGCKNDYSRREMVKC